MRARLQAALRAAMKARDAAAVGPLRSALAAIDNAQAVDAVVASVEHERFAGTAGALGAGEVPRAALDEAQTRAIVSHEVEGRRDAARDYDRLGQGEETARLRAEADLLAGFA